MSFSKHLRSSKDLVTPYEETRAGFISLALEKNRKATPFVEEAKALRVLASRAKTPQALFKISEIQNSLLTAAGVSNKASAHLLEADKTRAVGELIENFLEPAGASFIDELVYRFLLTKGDTLGGRVRNLAGSLGEWRFTRILMSTCSVSGVVFQYLDSKSGLWVPPQAEPETERRVKGLCWENGRKKRTLIYNRTVPLVKKNIDFCLLDCLPDALNFGGGKKLAHYRPEEYIALGELKGGIDPAGADEHWKTANSALTRIRKAFSGNRHCPKTFFIGAAIASAMAEEIYQQLSDRTLSNAANLTNEAQVVSLCDWLIKI